VSNIKDPFSTVLFINRKYFHEITDSSPCQV
jgi:hypothetical protein